MHLHMPHALYKIGVKEFFQLSFRCLYKKIFSPLKATKNEKIPTLLHKQDAMRSLLLVVDKC